MMPFRTDVGRVADTLDDPILRVDDRGVVVWRNERFRALAEGSGPTLLGRPLRELVVPADRNLVEAALTGLGGGATTAAAQIRIRSGDATTIPGRLSFLRVSPHDEHDGFVTVLLRVADG